MSDPMTPTLPEQLPPLPEPAAWRYQDSRGHYRYRGYKLNFDREYAILKPIPLYTAEQMQQCAEAATAAERERCALVCKRLSDEAGDQPYSHSVAVLYEGGQLCAAAIRKGA